MSTPVSCSTITRWECPECGGSTTGLPVTPHEMGNPARLFWSVDKSVLICPGVPVERIYVAVDALLQAAGNTVSSGPVRAAVDVVTSRNQNGEST